MTCYYPVLISSQVNLKRNNSSIHVPVIPCKELEISEKCSTPFQTQKRTNWTDIPSTETTCNGGENMQVTDTDC
jgi:hypothetical protein